ncbi:YdeI/OmpD-associated family protein [Sandarakinorhabdus sp. AAP62]|uniref:YdeI/OmpD-associated family protein n=1 Tax=Sandarakinorhabdus sp. AAP62 TaxID=1248916 RepID=UPI001FB16558|nr:YdeI/OmpD-associated family protein [Sandarakinorhabdus sp. AAP62]
MSAYIEAAQPFAQPILNQVRAAVHAALPDAAETMKWSMPFFTLNGRDVAMMAAFKAHAGVGIFDGGAMGGGEAMGNCGKLASVDDLPADLAARLQAAAVLAAQGKPMRAAAPRPARADIAMPDDLAAALAAHSAAEAQFAAFPPGARREYLEWVTSAKQPATRARRIETTVAQAAEGKRLNWKYEKC